MFALVGRVPLFTFLAAITGPGLTQIWPLQPAAGSKRKAGDIEDGAADRAASELTQQPPAKKQTPAKRAAWNSPCRPMRTAVPRCLFPPLPFTPATFHFCPEQAALTCVAEHSTDCSLKHPVTFFKGCCILMSAWGTSRPVCMTDVRAFPPCQVPAKC